MAVVLQETETHDDDEDKHSLVISKKGPSDASKKGPSGARIREEGIGKNLYLSDHYYLFHL